jgi:hypothetical protein
MHDPIRHNKEPGDGMAEDHPDRIPAPESFPPDESIAGAAGSFEEETRKQLNLLRERTFNPELRRLVDRIRVNEPPAGQQQNIPEIDGMSDDDLLLNLYRLFYRARTIRDNSEINISFDPYKIIDEGSSGDINEALVAHVTSMMNHLSLSPFALLSYDISSKGYIPAIHDFAGGEISNVVISLRDNLFQKIHAARNGILVHPDELKDDHYLNKIFSIEGDRPGGTIYLVMINNVIDEVGKELAESGVAPLSSFLPSSMLMVQLGGEGGKADAGDIARLIRERLSLPLFMLNDKQSLIYSLRHYDDLSSIFDVLDYFFSLFLFKKDRIGISLNIKSSTGTSLPFMMKYIISKLNKKLHSDSIIINVLKERLIILTEKEHMGAINAIFEEYEKLYKDTFITYEFRASDFRDAHEVIQKIIIDN